MLSDTLGKIVSHRKDLVRVIVQQKMVVAEMRPLMPMKALLADAFALYVKTKNRSVEIP
ncbi:hypothetical protein HDF08_002242 [Edaphobacter lichenicola]|uniref:Uncharacterized protein n=1 Tax=Tunturiibacter lichenicola TaxID=2051959 RepID=A0A852VJ29_9BACT|nr:hypothetical protein [Edaphobacter lichenicola]